VPLLMSAFTPKANIGPQLLHVRYDRRALPTQGTSTCHRRDRLFRICRHCRAQVGEVPRHFKIARYVALTKLASTDRSEPIAAATWAPASSGSNSRSRLQVEGPRSMSALGHKQTGAPLKVMSALPPTADVCGAASDVRCGPKADMETITSVQGVRRLRAAKSP
jgi:hypothetical protein